MGGGLGTSLNQTGAGTGGVHVLLCRRPVFFSAMGKKIADASTGRSWREDVPLHHI